MSKNVEKRLNKQESKKAIWRLAGLMKPFWALILLCCVLGVMLNLADLVKPYSMKIAVDEFLTKYAGMGSEAANAAAAGKNWFLNTLVGLGVTYFAVILIGAASSYIQSLVMTGVCQRILHDLRMKTFDHIHRLPLQKLDAIGSGRLLTRATNDIEALDEFYGDVLLGLFKDVYPDGRTKYHDNDAARCTEVREDGHETNWSCGNFICSIIEQMIGHPLVQFPYFGYRHPYKMYRKCYNTVDGEPGSYNAYWLQYLKCPDGTKMPVNRFFIELRGQPDKELPINEFITFLESEECRLNEQEREKPISFGLLELEALEM